MDNVLLGIQAHFTGSSDLMTTFPDGLWVGIAPPDSPFPRCVLHAISSKPDYDTGDQVIKQVTIQFSVHAPRLDVVAPAMRLIHTVFDFAPLTMTNATLLELRPTNEHVLADDERVYNGVVEYAVIVQETLAPQS